MVAKETTDNSSYPTGPNDNSQSVANDVPPDLQQLIAAWSHLSVQAREAITGMVQAMQYGEQSK